jgi:hypothetical protein
MLFAKNPGHVHNGGEYIDTISSIASIKKTFTRIMINISSTFFRFTIRSTAQLTAFEDHIRLCQINNETEIRHVRPTALEY